METVWRRSNQNRSLSNQEVSDLVHRFYGEDLGFMDDNEEREFFAEEISVHQNQNDSIVNDDCDNVNPMVIDDRKTLAEKDQPAQDQIKVDDDYSPKSDQVAQFSDKSNIDQEVNFNSIIPINSSTPINAAKSLTISESSLNEMIDEKEPPDTIVPDEISTEELNHDHNSFPTVTSQSSNISNMVTNEMKSLNRFFQAASLSMVEGSCRCSKHKGTLIIEKILPFPVDYLFELIFIDQNFIRYLHKTRQTTGMKITAWMPFQEKYRPQTPLPDGDYDIRHSEYRTMKYTIKLTGMPLIKSATVFESQYILQSDLNRAYCLFTQTKNQGIPYSDSFLISTTWCLNSCLPGDQQSSSTSIQLPTHTKI
ncbi:GRAM domain-containing protein [Euroglyphus maynei]|uniref:GRAM domain-containing protein n=1 Tax=Euroglyphus maynei TaxID=6958 RepID=A0A1Y3B3S5_EURMA|nr:GRAM domain-containing protein [Euroglyphus maynei]